MANSEASARYKYLIPMLAAANFLAAYGGGVILRLSDSFKTRNLIGALVLGTTLGLGLFLLLRSKWPHRISHFGGWISICGGLVSLLVLFILQPHLHEAKETSGLTTDFHANVIFLLLSIRFSLWFVARILRPDAVAGHRQKIGWVELLYYLGMIAGLISWQLIQGFGVNHSTQADYSQVVIVILIIDCLFQIIAGGIDLLAYRWSPAQQPAPVDDNSDAPAPKNYDRAWYARTVTAAVALTIGTQGVTFLLVSLLVDFAPNRGGGGSVFANNGLAVFYLGVACASIIYSFTKIRLEWPYSTQKIARFATLFMGTGESRKSFFFPLWSGIGAASLGVVIIGNNLRLDDPSTLSNVKGIFFWLCIAVAALIYEMLALAIFDHIGEEMEKLNRGKGMVAMAYGFLGVGVTIVLLLLEESIPKGLTATNWSPTSSDLLQIGQMHHYLLYVLTICFIIANAAMAWSANTGKLGARLKRRLRRGRDTPTV